MSQPPHYKFLNSKLYCIHVLVGAQLRNTLRHILIPCVALDSAGSPLRHGASWCLQTTAPTELSPVPGPASPTVSCGLADVSTTHHWVVGPGWASMNLPRALGPGQGWPSCPPACPRFHPRQGCRLPSGAAPS